MISNRWSHFFRWITATNFILAITACSTFPNWLSSAGPSSEQVDRNATSDAGRLLRIVDVTDALTRRVIAANRRTLFSETLGAKPVRPYTVGPGDVIEVSVWEAPPAVLFGASITDSRGGMNSSRVTIFQDQMVSSDGRINIPFAGSISVSGKTPQEIEAAVLNRLKDKANQPQVLARVTRNATANVTVIGEVTNSARVALTAKGERLLDALAASGGVRQPVGKTSIQITRDEIVQTLPLDLIIRDPRQNIPLQPGDVVTAIYQPLSFTALGATGKNEEIFFEAQGITLAQALARSGGLQDQRADAKGVFIFRYEEPLVLGVASENRPLNTEGKVPVIYRVDLKDPLSFFVAQEFPIHNKDVLYVSNAPAAELQKFLNILTSVVFSAQGLGAIGK